MPSYTLTYFNARGRAETTRMLFEVAGVEYEDKRLDGEQWKELKDKTPLGQMPLLEYEEGGKKHMLAQSMAITRFVANRFGLAGKTDIERADADMYVDTVGDIMTGLMAAFFAQEGKEEKLKAFGEKLPGQLEKLNKVCPSGGFFVGKGLTWADIFFFVNSSWFEQYNIDWATYPNLAAVREQVSSNPKIKAWIDRRPQTNM